MDAKLNETVGPLDLPRPKGKEPGCLATMLMAGGFGMVNGWTQATWRVTFRQMTGSSKAGADLAIALAIGIIFTLTWGLIHWLRRRKKPLEPLVLVLERRSTHLSSQVQSFPVWRGDSFWGRASMPLYRCLISVALLWFGLCQSDWFEKVSLCAIACLLFSPFVDEAQGVFQPLLVLDDRGVQSGPHVQAWSQIHKIEVEHLVNNSGGYGGTQWSFFGSNGQRLSRALIPEERCSQSREEKMLAYAAQMLGNRVAPVAPPALDWL